MKWLILCGLAMLGCVSYLKFHTVSSRAVSVKNGKYAIMLNTLLSRSVPEMDVSALAKDFERYTLLDARGYEEYQVSHLQNAKWIGYDHFESERVQELDLDQELVVYCSIGYRSEKITQKLLEQGFTNVSNLYGGIFEWVNQGHQLWQNDHQTQQVHAFSPMWGIWVQSDYRVYEFNEVPH